MEGTGAKSVLKRTYDWVMGLAEHRHALSALALIAFIESSVFPIPPDILLIPMVLAVRTRAWRIAAICTVASVAGGAAGYGIGYFLFEALGQPMVEFYDASDAFQRFQAEFAELGWWIVMGAGFTPFPYKVVTILSGVAALDPWTFLLASTVSRGGRFFIEAALLYYFGPPIRAFVEKRLALVTAVIFVVLIGVVVVKYLL